MKSLIKNSRNNLEYFLLYCLVGWLYESILCCMIIDKEGFVNRGFLFGPWLPIYGIGALVILKIFKTLNIKNPIGIFVVGTVIATIAELIGSYVADIVAGGPLWDYTGYFMNFDGRIALIPDLAFGVMIWIAIYLVQPIVIKLQNKYDESKIRNISFIVIISIFLIDLISRIWLGSNLPIKGVK